jgi:hypothetical protein
MREQRFQRLGGHRLAWSTAVGAFVCLVGLAIGSTRAASLVAGLAAGVAALLLVRLYEVSWSGRA